MIKKISHHTAFNIVKNLNPGKDIRYSSHLPMGVAGGLSLLENATLFSLMKIVSPKFIFEFGTYFGASSVLMAENSEHDTKVYTLDLPSNDIDVDPTKELDQNEKEQNDDFLRLNYKVNGPIYINNSKKEVKEKINCIKEDSLLFSPEKEGVVGLMDFVFVDGGHNTKIIDADTKNAIKMIKKDGIIVWHDYSSNIHTDVTDYLNSFSEEYDIYHVDNTMIAFMPLGKYKNLFYNIDG